MVGRNGMSSGSIRVALGGDVLCDLDGGDARAAGACSDLVACSRDTDDTTGVAILGGVAASVFSVRPRARGVSSSTTVVPVLGFSFDVEGLYVSTCGDSPGIEGSGCRSCGGAVAVLMSLSPGGCVSSAGVKRD